jgi:hypothetical protein
MKTPYSFRQFNINDLPELYRLYASIYGEKCKYEEFSWKYIQHEKNNFPVIGMIAHTVSSQDSKKIIAFYGVFPMRCISQEYVCVIAQSGDTMTDPEHQGKGLFVQLAKATYTLCQQQGVQLIFGFPNGNSAPGFFKKLDWHKVENMMCIYQILPTLPLQFFPIKNTRMKYYLRKWDFLITKILGFKDENYSLQSSITNAKMCGIYRDEFYKSLKYRDLMVYEGITCQVIVKMGRDVDIGDMSYLKTTDLLMMLLRVSLAAILTGRPVVKSFISKNNTNYNLLRKFFLAKESLPLGTLPLTEDGKTLQPIFSYIDYDTF